jgi:hypothetical protein
LLQRLNFALSVNFFQARRAQTAVVSLIHGFEQASAGLYFVAPAFSRFAAMKRIAAAGTNFWFNKL